MDINEKYSVQSLARGIVGLEAAIEMGSIRPNDLARRLGINRSSAYRLLCTLDAFGYLCQDGETKCFYPNYEKLASLMPPSWKWMQLADRNLYHLCQETSLPANLGTIEYGDIVYARSDRPESPEAEQILLRPRGARRPSSVTALGKAVLAFQKEAKTIDDYIELGLIRPNKKYPLNADTLLTHLEQIRKNQYAIDDEELEKGWRCIAAPIFDCEQNVVAAIGLNGKSSMVSMQRLPELAQRVISSAAQISSILLAAEYRQSSEEWSAAERCAGDMPQSKSGGI